MIIAVDCRFGHLQVGLGRFTRELVSSLLSRNDPWEYVLLISEEGRSWVNALPGRPRFEIAGARGYSMREQWEIPSLLRRISADLYFSPHFNVPLLCPIPFVVTVHDLILHRFPNAAPVFRQWAYRVIMRHSMRAARSIIAVSRFTAGEIARTYGATVAAKVAVVKEGVDTRFHFRSFEEQEETRRKFGIVSPYYLYVGNAKEHKNVQLLIDGFFRAALTGVELVLVTAGRETSSLHLCDGVRFLDSVSDDELASLYSGARGFVTASLYEGYCLPVCEAAACGCPVIATRCGAIPEVAPKEALLIDPTVESFSQALRSPPGRTQVESPLRWQDTAETVSKILAAALP